MISFVEDCLDQASMIQKNILLASASPRRAFLLRELGITFRIDYTQVDEIVPIKIKPREAAGFLAELKGKSNLHLLKEGELLIAADTIVLMEDEILGKPSNNLEAKRTLLNLSDQSHRVISGVYISDGDRAVTFSVETEVEMDSFSQEEIDYYVTNFKPMDKAGSYGIQEWIGWSKVARINGSYSNIMGLPTREVYQALCAF